MDHKSILDALDAMRKDMAESDPLAQKGIGPDYVCCMNAQTYADLKRQIEQQHPFPFQSTINRVEALVRRPVWIFNDLDYGRVEYMPYEKALLKDSALMRLMRYIQQSDAD